VILVIDDEAVMRNMATEILQEFGYRVVTADDGKQGVALFKEYQFEIQAVILDMAMPVMSGREAYLEMKKLNPEYRRYSTWGATGLSGSLIRWGG
jgi:CheY-like chemotaxis protein